uniref:Uncharacterized protein n=1 Tax=viral metagenome TaxID=1070528 RepID=A0A6M3LX09_9ZZZZ
MANTNSPFSFRFYKMDSGMPAPAMISVTLASSIGCKRGDPLYLSSGYGQIAKLSQAPFAFADEEITASTGVQQACLAIPAIDGMVLKAQSIGTVNAAVTHKATAYQAGGSADGAYGVNLDETVNGPYQLIDKEPNSEWGSYAVLLVKVKRTQYSGQA